MKRENLLLVITTVILIAAGVRYWNAMFNRPCERPQRPNGIPLNAKWNGDCDGGYWIDLVEVKEKKYRFRIYLDYAPIVTMDADFILADSCRNVTIPSDTTIMSKIAIVNEESILIRLDEPKRKLCYLIPIYPAYGGLTWDTIKKNGNY